MTTRSIDPADVATCPFNLGRLMRRHKVTIRELAARMGVTLKQVRMIRAAQRVPYLVYCDWTEGVTGRSVFCLGRYRAMTRQIERGEYPVTLAMRRWRMG